jgi:uncharacterized RmlC-like cupin family protein
MNNTDDFHPDLTQDNGDTLHRSLRSQVHHIKTSELRSDTAQTDGMRRMAALTGNSVGTESIWMGETHVSPTTRSGNHHHGKSETAIFVRSGNPTFVFRDGVQEVRIVNAPGDYVFVPPFVPHREENPDPNNPAVIVVARSTQEPIVVNLPRLYPLSEPGTTS